MKDLVLGFGFWVLGFGEFVQNDCSTGSRSETSAKATRASPNWRSDWDGVVGARSAATYN